MHGERGREKEWERKKQETGWEREWERKIEREWERERDESEIAYLSQQDVISEAVFGLHQPTRTLIEHAEQRKIKKKLKIVINLPIIIRMDVILSTDQKQRSTDTKIYEEIKCYTHQYLPKSSMTYGNISLIPHVFWSICILNVISLWFEKYWHGGLFYQIFIRRSYGWIQIFHSFHVLFNIFICFGFVAFITIILRIVTRAIKFIPKLFLSVCWHMAWNRRTRITAIITLSNVPVNPCCINIDIKLHTFLADRFFYGRCWSWL